MVLWRLEWTEVISRCSTSNPVHDALHFAANAALLLMVAKNAMAQEHLFQRARFATPSPNRSIVRMRRLPLIHQSNYNYFCIPNNK